MDDPSPICPECGRSAIVQERFLKKYESLARGLLWINGTLSIGGIANVVLDLTGGSPPITGLLLFLLWLVGLGSSIAGVIIFGYGLDRPFLR
ncbi:MAG: hypothetical protein JKY96_03230, partial [Phycisphaerales bacterium]|nr:hypothetical protein [Phycisphaerales bacterium]